MAAAGRPVPVPTADTASSPVKKIMTGVGCRSPRTATRYTLLVDDELDPDERARLIQAIEEGADDIERGNYVAEGFSPTMSLDIGVGSFSVQRRTVQIIVPACSRGQTVQLSKPPPVAGTIKSWSDI